MTDSLFNANERKLIKTSAKAMGYSGFRAYLRWLVEMDAKRHGIPSPLQEDEFEHPAEGFRRAWVEMKEGRTMTSEEFRRAMQEDND